jgi:hypothetical protein
MKKNLPVTQDVARIRVPESETLTAVLLDMFARIKQLSSQYIKAKSNEKTPTEE